MKHVAILLLFFCAFNMVVFADCYEGPDRGAYDRYRKSFSEEELSCWCEPYQCAGDTVNNTETFYKFRVFISDLNEIIMHWKKTYHDSTLNPCADVDHQGETFWDYRVFIGDLNVIVTNWRATDDDLAGDCNTE